MTEDDLGSVVAIECASTPAPWTVAQFRAEWEKPHSRSWVFTDDETDEDVAAFVVFWMLGHQGHILEVATHPERRRQGFARALLQAVVREAIRLEVTEILLEVRKSNEGALALYQSLNFDICQVRKQFYSNGDDAYVLRLGLEGPRVEI